MIPRPILISIKLQRPLGSASLGYGAFVCLTLTVAGATAAPPDDSGGLSETEAAVRKAVAADLVDLVVAIDNSASMGTEISALEAELYVDLVAPLTDQGIDVRVIVISRHGDDVSESVCFEEPLSSVPAGGCSPPPVQPGITDGFKHYSLEIGSHDLWCHVLDTFDGTTPDEFGLAPSGWSSWLRDDALKVFLAVTDDSVLCGSYDDGDSIGDGATTAAAIDEDLAGLSEVQFGTTDDRTYVVHALVGIEPNTVPTEPWPPTSPINDSSCLGAVDPGTGHQGLAVLTDGLRFPVCSTDDYDAFLGDVASDTLARLPIFTDGFESGDATAWSGSTP